MGRVGAHGVGQSQCGAPHGSPVAVPCCCAVASERRVPRFFYCVSHPDTKNFLRNFLWEIRDPYMLLATIASASMALAAPALGRSALWHNRAVVRMSTASLVQKSRYAEDEEWIQRLDLPAFGAEVRALGRRLRDEEGAADLEHFRRIRRWTRVCGAVGVATMGLPLNPLTVVALSTWTYASWTMVAHHTCHGGYDRHDAQPGQDRFHDSRFALGGVLNRGRDWLDWMLPEAWNLEHNVLHHYKLGEAGDPDLVERNLDFLRVATLPRVLKVAYVALMAGIWKCAPLCNSCASEHTICARFGVGSRLIAL